MEAKRFYLPGHLQIFLAEHGLPDPSEVAQTKHNSDETCQRKDWFCDCMEARWLRVIRTYCEFERQLRQDNDQVKLHLLRQILVDCHFWIPDHNTNIRNNWYLAKPPTPSELAKRAWKGAELYGYLYDPDDDASFEIRLWLELERLRKKLLEPDTSSSVITDLQWLDDLLVRASNKSCALQFYHIAIYLMMSEAFEKRGIFYDGSRRVDSRNKARDLIRSSTLGRSLKNALNSVSKTSKMISDFCKFPFRPPGDIN